MTLSEKLVLMADAARQAGKLVSSSRDFAVERKAQNDFVTEMDKASEALIRKILLSACPEDSFYGEESGGETATEGRFIVDPIDGTTNFIKGIYAYTISIAYELRGEFVLGCVYCPTTDEMFTAESGKGAYLNGERIHVSTVSELSDSIIGMAFAHRNPMNRRYMMDILPRFTESVNDLRRIGSAAYDLASVACGRYEAFCELGLYIYDYAAGVVLVREAGGRVSPWFKSDNYVQSGSLCATNARIDEELLPILRKE